jgi:hypothetical protein
MIIQSIYSAARRHTTANSLGGNVVSLLSLSLAMPFIATVCILLGLVAMVWLPVWLLVRSPMGCHHGNT